MFFIHIYWLEYNSQAKIKLSNSALIRLRDLEHKTNQKCLENLSLKDFINKRKRDNFAPPQL